jgi:hypothetical protein
MPNQRNPDKVLFRAFLTKEEKAELYRLVNESGAENATDYIRRLLTAAIEENAKAKRLAKKNETNNNRNNKK